MTHVTYGDEAVLQEFIRSGGTETTFYSQGDKVFWRQNGKQTEVLIYPKEKNILLYGGIPVVVLFMAGLGYIAVKKK